MEEVADTACQIKADGHGDGVSFFGKGIGAEEGASENH